MKSVWIVFLVVGVLVGLYTYKVSASERVIYNNEFLNEKMMESENMNSEVTGMKGSVVRGNLALPDNPNKDLIFDKDKLEDLYLAGGCFWGLEAYMTRVYGVYDVTSGYANGDTENPSYEDLIYRNSGHAETVHIKYDPERVDMETLLAYYLKVVDPTSLNNQGNDRGTQYRTGIYYTDESQVARIEKVLSEEQSKYDKAIVIEVEKLEHYYLAEEYHQDYLEKNPNGYCHIDLNEVKETLIDPSDYTKPSEESIKSMLTDLQFRVTQEDGTEPSFNNKYWDNKKAGIYVDIVTGEPLFSSKDKYKSGTGWPSFVKPISEDVVTLRKDFKLFSPRVEVRSRVGDSHLGHVFEDGPSDRGGLRYCMNSASMKFIALEEMDEMGYGHLKHLVE
ncbi:MAG: peptide-methionine (R)-S-oxide reductase MsrB [Firmicutes bacterium]|jgi:peptide methionine sulfoxide reductase msrA/msrB|nr:peptide-methionine (R)-S-oxide reductase MsrB [Bacillota bacterium]